MTNITEIFNDGFLLSGNENNITSLALLSLRLALNAFFSTYQSMKFSLHIFDKEYQEYGVPQNSIDSKYSSSYVEKSTESILHLHHFIELVMKDILRDEHPLLADNTWGKHLILHKLIKGEALTEEDNQSLKSIEFGEAKNRLFTLVREHRLAEYSRLNFLLNYNDFLNCLNGLRNRLWHRGVFIIRYPALDSLFGNFALPFIQEVTELPNYSGMEQYWKYDNISCSVDPIEYIVNDYQVSQDDGYNIGKVALLKELGRAAYHQPTAPLFSAKQIGTKKYTLSGIDTELIQRAERIAATEKTNVVEVRPCPVCGVNSLTIYYEIEVEPGYPHEEPYLEAWRYTSQAVCMCCSFDVNHYLDNPCVYGIPIDNLWYREVLS